MISVRHKLVAEGLPPPSWRAPQGRGNPANQTTGAADAATYSPSLRNMPLNKAPLNLSMI